MGAIQNALPVDKLLCMRDHFRVFAQWASTAFGSPWAFTAAIIVVVVWAITGPLFGFSDTWQLVINTGTTIVTFLMVFIIQNTQNRDAKAIHIKLDELLRAIAKARTGLVGLEDMSEQELDRLHEEFTAIREQRSNLNFEDENQTDEPTDSRKQIERQPVQT